VYICALSLGFLSGGCIHTSKRPLISAAAAADETSSKMKKSSILKHEKILSWKFFNAIRI
jgi:hypothetical protein